jgi:hypothetical protein
MIGTEGLAYGKRLLDDPFRLQVVTLLSFKIFLLVCLDNKSIRNSSCPNLEEFDEHILFLCFP